MQILYLSLMLALVQGGRICNNPKSNDGESYTEGCLKMTCKTGFWRSSLDTSLCCYNRQPYLPNTTITATEDGCASAIVHCKQEDDVATAVLQVENTCGDHSTEEQVQDLKLLLVKHMEQTDCDKDSPVSTSTTSTTTISELGTEGYILSSSGGAAEYRGSRLGIYDEVKGYDSVVYKQRGETYYIYSKNDPFGDTFWWCGDTIGGRSINLSSGRSFYRHYKADWWSFYSSDGGWTEDQTLQFLPLTPTSCILQPSVLITSTGPASSITPDYLGSFTVVPGVFSAGRPVWRNTKGRVLKINPGTITFAVYDDIELTTRRAELQSSSAPICPTDIKAGHSARNGYNAWRYWNGTKWVEDGTIVVQ